MEVAGALEVSNLTIGSSQGSRLAGPLSLSVSAGEVVALVGPSGSGKTLTLRAIAGVLPRGAHITDGAVHTGGSIGLVFQDPTSSFNPRWRLGRSFREVLVHATGCSTREWRQRMAALLEDVGLAAGVSRRFPHELSGGMAQRAAIALSLATNPAFLLADELTSSLDSSTAEKVIALVLRLAREKGIGFLIVSHHRRRIGDAATRVVETADADSAPGSPPPQHAIDEHLHAQRPGRHTPHPGGSGTILALSQVTRVFGSNTVLSDIDLTVSEGEAVGIRGVSGAGKSTLARICAGVDTGFSGVRRVNAEDSRHRAVALVHQDSLVALNPRIAIGWSLAEAAAAHGRSGGPTLRSILRHRAHDPRIGDTLKRVRLPPNARFARPTRLSGGQRQRVALARALLSGARVLVLDEPVAALDPSTRRRIVELIRTLHREQGVTLVVVSHDHDVLDYLCTRQYLLRKGRLWDLET